MRPIREDVARRYVVQAGAVEKKCRIGKIIEEMGTEDFRKEIL
ncbi:MAG: hypothetical protein PHG20_11775 [Geobacteraceae bacterium]|nr:hypothetical protein [Geobacteraceae bacterium]